MEAMIVDPHYTSNAEREQGMKEVGLVFGINHTMPFTDEYNNLVKQLFEGNIENGAGVLFQKIC